MAAPFPEFYNSADSAVISSPITASVNAGNQLAAVQYNLWNDKGATQSSTTLSRARLRVVAFNGTNKVSSGLPALDEGWPEVRLIGQNKIGDASMVEQSSPWIPLGTNRTLLLSDIPKNCARHLEFRVNVPGGAANNTQEIYLELVYDETSTPLGEGTSLWTSGGILPAWHDSSKRVLTSGGAVTASGTDVVAVARRWYSYDAIPYSSPNVNVTLNQTANDGALTAGQSYIAVLSQASGSATVTTTKGNRASSPTAPATPASQIFISLVTVTYQAGGTSIINQGNVDQTATFYDEFKLALSSGLNIKIYSGRALTTSDTKAFQTTTTTLAITNADNDYVIWVYADGTFTHTAIGAAAPAASAVPIGLASVVGGAVTSVQDVTAGPAYRRFAQRAVDDLQLVLKYHGPLSVLTDVAWDVLTVPAVLDFAEIIVGTVGSGGGSATFDINYRNGAGSMGSAGTTIYTNQATDDRRPVVAATSTQASPKVGFDVINFDVGVVGPVKFSLDIDAMTMGTAALDVFAILHFRRK